MKVCILDGKLLDSGKALHRAVSEALDFPDWYGENLDALYDCLTDSQEETEILIVHKQKLEEHLGNYVSAMTKMLSQAEKENPRFRWRMED